MHRRRLSNCLPRPTAILAIAWALAPVFASAQLGSSVATSQFELSEAIQLDRADSTTDAQLQRAKASLADRQWDEAVETLRQLMENSEGKLIGITPHRFIALSDFCQIQLAAMPPEALKLYRSRVDAVAQKWYEDGTRRRDRKSLLRVVQQAFASSWGDKALLALGDMALESAETTTARRYWERILPVQIPPGQQRTWPGYPDTHLDLAGIRARLVLVSILEGDEGRGRAELDQFIKLHGECRGPLGGREVQYAAALAELLKQRAAWKSPPASWDWPTFAGDFTRGRIAAGVPDVGAVQWRIPLPLLTPARQGPALPGTGLRASAGVAEDAAAPLACHPILVGDHIFLNDQRQIVAIKVASGKPVWGEQEAAIYRHATTEPLSALFSPSECLGTGRFTLTIHGNRLYARMGRAVTSQPQHAPTNLASSSLVCLDLADEGRVLWRIDAEEGWAFDGAPVVEGSGLFVAMRHSDIRPQAHVACLDSQTGAIRWRRFVCSAETPARGMLYETTSNLLTLVDHTLYFNTNLGAVAALGTDQGRLEWVSLYPRSRTGDLARLDPHWQRDLTPCLADRGVIYVAPTDSREIFAFDASTGQVLWQTGATEVDDVVHLLGVAGDQLLASGRRLLWISVDPRSPGRIKHVWPEGPEKPGYGRGVLAGDQVLWPTRSKIFLLDAKTAQPRKSIDLGDLGIGGGNLLVGKGRLFVATATELIALGEGSATPKAAATEITANENELGKELLQYQGKSPGYSGTPGTGATSNAIEMATTGAAAVNSRKARDP